MIKRAFSYAVLAALLCLGGTFAWADNSARIVRLSLVDGSVTIDRADGMGRVDAILNMPIVQGADIVTGHDGYAELEFERGSTIRLAPNSSLHVDQLGRGDNGREITALTVKSGLVYFDLQKKEADTFQIATSDHQISVPKQAHFRLQAGPDGGEVAVFDGNVQVNGAGVSRAEVKKGDSLRFDAGGKYELARNITPDSTDSWDQDREQYRDTYAANNYNAGYTGYSSAYSYGVGDLNYWGNYYYAPGWGWVWQPYNVGYGWNPWMNGAWMWYPSWGWTWISTYPWGWTPYRYGNWAFVPTYGWCWQPSNTWATWHAVPPASSGISGGAVAVAPRPVPPSRPPMRGTPSVIMVNDGPRWENRAPGARPAMMVDGAGGRPGTRPSSGMTTATPAPGAMGAKSPSVKPSMRPAPSTGVRPAAPAASAPRPMATPPAARPPAPSPRVEAPRMESPRMQMPPPPPAMSAPAPSAGGASPHKR